MALGFYWSPLKIFEYMAAGLPVVAPRIDRIPALVEDGREGILYDPAEPGALAAALEKLTDPSLRRTLGAAAPRPRRARLQLEGSLRGADGGGRGAAARMTMAAMAGLKSCAC